MVSRSKSATSESCTYKQTGCVFLRYSKYSVCLSQDHYVKKYPQIMLKIHEAGWGRRGGAGERDAVFLPLCPVLPVCLIFSILFSVFFLFFFFWSSPPLWHPTSSACSGGKKKRRLHSNYPAGTAHEGYSGCIKFITDQRDRFRTLLLRRSLCFHIHYVSCATPWLLRSGPVVTLFPTSLLSFDDLGGRGREVIASSLWPEGGQWWTQHDSGKKYLGKITGKHRSVQQKKKPQED